MKRRLRVLFAIGSMDGGGAERQTVNYLRHLDRSLFAPSLYLHYRQGELLQDVPQDVPVVAFWDRHTAPRVNLPGRVQAMQVRDLARVLEEEHIDVLCAVTFLLAIVAAGSAPRRRTPWLAIEMADPRLDFANQTTRFRWLKKRILARAYRHSGSPVGVSSGVSEGIQEYYGVPGSRIATLPNFIDLDCVDELSREAPPTLSKEVFHITTVGRLAAQKGHVFLLRAVRQLVHEYKREKVCLHILGSGPLERELRHFVEAEKLTNQVEFAGYVANPLPFVRHSHLFVLPSIYEGLPLALLEALACRTPVLATDCPSGPREVLADGRFGQLVPPGDAPALASSICNAMDQYLDWKARTDEARNHVESQFSVRVGISALQRLIQGSHDPHL